MSGSIPEEIYGISSLEVLDLNTNKFTGTLSTKIGNLSNLQTLQLYDNLMTGKIPTEMGDASSLLIVNLHQNDFTGYMPVEVCANVDPIGSIQGLTADCGGSDPQVICTCCTGCTTN